MKHFHLLQVELCPPPPTKKRITEPWSLGSEPPPDQPPETSAKLGPSLSAPRLVIYGRHCWWLQEGLQAPPGAGGQTGQRQVPRLPRQRACLPRSPFPHHQRPWLCRKCLWTFGEHLSCYRASRVAGQKKLLRASAGSCPSPGFIVQNGRSGRPPGEQRPRCLGSASSVSAGTGCYPLP